MKLSAPKKVQSAGFTLIEILVAATILATLTGGVLLTLNPLAQINKGQDAQRLTDIQAVKTALDLYYQDHKCYPPALGSGLPNEGIPFGREWKIGNTVYMKKVPQDPKCGNDQTACYKYRTVADSSDPTYSCPQWNVVFGQLSKASALTNVCPLSSLSNCTPSGYTNGVWACTLSGAVNCDSLMASASIGGGAESAPTSTPPPSATPTPTPTPDPNEVTFPLIQGGTPDNYQISLTPLWPLPGDTQKVKVWVSDTVKIGQVQVVVSYDNNKQTTFSLNPPVGVTTNSGVWSGVRQLGSDETYNRTYDIEIFAKEASPSSSVGYAALPVRNAGK